MYGGQITKFSPADCGNCSWKHRGNYIERTPFIKVIVSIACISHCLGVLVQNVSWRRKMDFDRVQIVHFTSALVLASAKESHTGFIQPRFCLTWSSFTCTSEVWFRTKAIISSSVVTVPKFQYSVPIPVKIHGFGTNFGTKQNTKIC